MRLLRKNLTEWAAQEVLSRYALSAKADGRFPSERVMAKEIEVSLPTLREGLLRLQKDGRIVRKHGKGTFLAPEDFSTKPTGILIEFDLTMRSASAHYLPLALLIQRKLKAEGRKSEIYFGHRQADDTAEGCLCEEFVEAVRGQRFDSIAVVAGLRSEEWLAPLRQQGVRVVGANSLFDTSIQVDREYWMNRAVETLRADGRHQIAYIGWAGRRPLNPGMKPGHELFMECLKWQGMHRDSSLIRDDLPPSMEGAGWEEFREIWMRPPDERPDGLVVSDDILLRGCLEAIQESRVEIPETLHIVALVNDYFRAHELQRVSRFEISTEETANLFVQALLHPDQPIPLLQPEFLPVSIPSRSISRPSQPTHTTH